MYIFILGAMVITIIIDLQLCNRNKYKITPLIINDKFFTAKNMKGLIAYVSLLLFNLEKYFVKSKANEFSSILNYFIIFKFIIFVILCVGMLYGILIYKNKHTYFNTLLIFMTTFLYIDIFSMIFIENIEVNKWIFIFTGIIIFLLNSFKIEKQIKVYEENLRMYSPIEKFSDLFENRQYQVKYLKNKIFTHKSNENLSICISGEWGSGKTSFMNATIDYIKENEGHIVVYDYIKINAMDMDNLESLVKYLFLNIENILINEKYYIGILSEYKNYISSIIEIITKSQIKSSAITNLLSQEKNYRNIKIQFESMLNDLLGEKKVVIIIDDIERCDSKRVIDFISFVKEVITFKNFIIIFLTDYNQLEKCISKDNKPVSFLDKFFNIRINLYKVSYMDIIDKLSSKYQKKLVLLSDINISISSELDNLLKKNDKSIFSCKKELESLKNGDTNELKSRRENLRKCIARLEENQEYIQKLVSNPRNAVKLVQCVIEKCNIINEQLYNKDYNNQKIKNYLQKIKAVQSIILLSFIQIYMPEKYEEVSGRGENYIINIRNNITKDQQDEIITLLSFELWYTEIITFKSHEYEHDENLKLSHNLWGQVPDLKYIEKGYTSYDEKYIALLESNNIDTINISFNELLHIIIRNFSYNYTDKGSSLLDKLFEYAFTQYKIEEACKEILYEVRSLGSISPNLRVMKLFFQKLNNKKKEIKEAYTIKKLIDALYNSYLRSNMKYLKKAYSYVYDIDNIEFSEIVFEVSLIDKFEDALEEFCLRYKNIIFGDGDCFCKLKKSIQDCENKLKKIRDLQFYDTYIKENIKKAYIQVEEFNYFNKIINFLCEQDRLVERDIIDINNVSYENLESNIEKINSVVKNERSMNEEIIQLIKVFINKIYDEKYNLTEQNITKLKEMILRCRNYMTDDEIDYCYSTLTKISINQGN